jgi:hypothetical protein
VNYLRIGLALAGFAAALFAVSLQDDRIGWVAIGLLLGSRLARLLQKRTHKGDMDARSDEKDSM